MVGTRGVIPAPAPGQQFDSIIEAAIAAHSTKPDAAIAMIERMFPHAKRLEMYARAKRPGWDVFGNQV